MKAGIQASSVPEVGLSQPVFRVIENFVSTRTEIQILGSDSSANNEPKQEKAGAKLLKDFLKGVGETLSC